MKTTRTISRINLKRSKDTAPDAQPADMCADDLSFVIELAMEIKRRNEQRKQQSA